MTDLGEGDWKRALKKYFTDRSQIMNHTFFFRHEIIGMNFGFFFEDFPKLFKALNIQEKSQTTLF